VDLGPLRDSREFRLLWIGQLISMTGRQVTVVAIPYQIYVLTGSTLAVGLLGLVQAVPLVLAAREIARDPKVLIAAQPTRGLDVGAIEYLHRRIVSERDEGRGRRVTVAAG